MAGSIPVGRTPHISELEVSPKSLFFQSSMKKSPSRFSRLAATVFVLLASGNAPAQETTQNGSVRAITDKPAATLAVHVDEVDLSFVATDRHHRWITNLGEDELRLRDNGKPPESMGTFQAQTGLPLRVGLLLDTSDSIAEQFGFEQNAAAWFINDIVDPAKDLAFIMGFSNKPVLAQDLTGDTHALATALQNLSFGGTTAIYDAVSFACLRLRQHSEGSLARRVLVLVTDGDDNSSHLQPKQVIEETARHDVVVFVLHTDPAPNVSDAKYRVLEKLATETGGEILPAGKKKQIQKAFAHLSSELRSFYLLTYHPAQFSRNGTYRKIQLKTTRHGIHIICRRGYYATP